MSQTDHDQDKFSYFIKYKRQLEASSLSAKARELIELLVSFSTLNTYRKLLYDPGTHLVDDITEVFLHNVIIPDLGRIIIALQEYKRQERRRLREARQFVDSALLAAYKAEHKEGRVASLLDCRENLGKACRHLEHLKEFVPLLSKE